MQKGAFRVKRNIFQKLAKCKKKIDKRVKKRNWENQARPMLSASNIHYDIDGRNKGIANGGIGIIHQMAGKSGLVNEIDTRLGLLKRLCRIINLIIYSILPITFLPGAIVFKISNY
jgi:hypothetical protein